jgi:hypothetical protein
MKTLVVLALAVFPTASTFVVRSKSIRGGTALGLTAKGLFRTMGVLPAAVTLTEQYAPQAAVSRIVASIVSYQFPYCRIC